MLNILCKIGHRLNEANVLWAVGASLLLSQKGLYDQPHDIDLIVSTKDIHKADEILKELGVKQIWEKSEQFITKYFNEYLIDGIEVDVMSGLAINHALGTYYYEFDEQSIGEIAEIENVKIPLMTLEDWHILYQIIPGREKRVAEIERYFSVNPVTRADLILRAFKKNLPMRVKVRSYKWIQNLEFKNDQVADNQVADDQVADDQVADNQVADDQVADDQVADEQFTNNQLQNEHQYFQIAVPDDSEALSQLAVRSESYWGNDKEYMDAFETQYSVTAKFVKENFVMMILEDHHLIGFYGLSSIEPIELEFFYIDPLYIGHGYGALIWHNLMKHCEALSVNAFDLVTSPEAKDFYLKMGAVHVCDIESKLRKNRMIPKLHMLLNSDER